LAELAVGPSERVGFGKDERGEAFLRGYWRLESDGSAWSTDRTAEVIIPTSFPKPKQVVLHADATFGPSVAGQPIEVRINDAPPELLKHAAAEGDEFNIVIPESEHEKIEDAGYLRLQIMLPESVDLGLQALEIR
jgi:hypothetical protein